MIVLVNDPPVLPLYCPLQPPQRTTLNSFGPSAPPHHVNFTFATAGPWHFGHAAMPGSAAATAAALMVAAGALYGLISGIAGRSNHVGGENSTVAPRKRTM